MNSSPTPIEPFTELVGARLLFAAKEAGAGSLLAALAREWRPAPESLCLVSETAAPYFEQSGLVAKTVAGGAPGMAMADLATLVRDRAPQAIVCGASAGPSIEKLAIRAGQQLGIPVHSFVDHYWNLWQRFADEKTARRWTYLPEQIHVPAEQCRTNIIAAGCPAERVTVFDHPLLAMAATGFGDVDRSGAREALGLARDAVVWLFVSEYGFPPSDLWRWEQPAESDIEGLLRLVLSEAARANGEGGRVAVIVKRHPAETRDWHWLCAEYPTVATTIVDSLDKAKLFAASDAAFGLNSMLLLEAAQAGLPAYSHHVSDLGRETWLSTIRPEIQELAAGDELWAALG